MFENGTSLKTINGSSIIINKFIGHSSQGDLYSVSFVDGERDLLLKWISNSNDNRTYDHYYNIYCKQPFVDYFAWFVTLVEKNDSGFGIVSPMPPANYRNLNDILSGRVEKFASEEAKINFCLNLVCAFRKLNNAGLCYYVFEPYMFWTDCKTGDLFITDCDFISISNMKLYSHLYISFCEAPEIFNYKALPSSSSNLFSIAIIVFLVLFDGHPFRGERYIKEPFMSHSKELVEYGEKAVFIFDPEDDSNRPVASIMPAVIEGWKKAPDYLQEFFERTFSQETIHEPNKRTRHSKFIDVLLKYKSDLLTCECGEVIIYNTENEIICSSCGRKMDGLYVMETRNGNVPLNYGRVLFKKQLCVCHNDEALTPVVTVKRKQIDHTLLGLKNCCNENIIVYFSDGNEAVLEPQKVIPLEKITGINIFGSIHKISKRV